MPTNQLIHRRVIVTGGLGALGRRVGAELSARGARVALVDRAASVAIDAVEAVFGNVDLGDAANTANAFGQIAGRLGGIDALVNIAGGFAWETLESGSIETWDRLYAMNVRTAAIASHEVLPYLLREKSARIVNVGALAAQKAGAGMGAYAASKAGVARLTEALAEELKDRNVTVNAVLPSIIDTPANRTAMPDADTSRWVAADQLAAVIAFLLSDDASAVTGACLPVAGRM
ncbi:SDR family NAD(P)-dependent oxidoreductase [Paraburkholderia fungorum]|uniref:SDR family NAD(P)-dependent oxidoreductase n=1 Tax=Paraburkholderia fungorum TaxID=134537 RepID=UPI001C1ED852|nr:SDR family NAD(P)-dependent oxidoreductase [Paraburkholderia fungorum]MBU7439266.1 SDR family NAD(P)-dependent oxidoreductase [Paraburkholderia fungorum]